MRSPRRLFPLASACLVTLALAACSDGPAAGQDAVDTTAPGDTLDDTADTTPADTSDASDTTPSDTTDDTALDTSDTADGSPDVDPDVTDTAGPSDAFFFEPIQVDGLPPLWGAVTAGRLFIGGVDGTQKVRAEIHGGTFAGTTLTATEVASQDVPRYCQCALHDPTRNELLVVGGRGSNFGDVTSVVLIDLDTGDATPIDTDGVADFPVGCAAFFSGPHDRGYVFGGLSSTQRAFTASTWRWDPTDRTFTELAAVGPSARYDAAVHVLDNGDVLLLGGMGLADGAPTYPTDVWRFNGERETWREVAITGERPPGRRYAWTSLAPDESILLFGYGSDAPNGSHMLADLWQLDLEAKTWSAVEVVGALPKARGFVPNWQLDGALDAGLMAFGADFSGHVYLDAFVLRVPDRLKGRWH